MFDIICTFDGRDKFYSILDFQNLSDSDIEKLRHTLICPDCRELAFYRKRSGVGKTAHFTVDRQVDDLDKVLKMISDNLEMIPKGDNKS